VPVPAVKHCKGVEVDYYSLLISALDGGVSGRPDAQAVLTPPKELSVASEPQGSLNLRTSSH